VATFGDLVVRLNLDKRGFDRGIGDATSGLPGLRTAALAASAGIAAAAGAATAAALAFKAWLAPSFEALDTLGDLSKRLGVATDSLSGLQHAAKLAGVDQDGLTIGIQKFLDTLSNASMGTESAVKAFDALGLKASALKNLSLEQQFIAVADALKNIQNPADRVRIALDLFGKSGAQMLQLMADGSGDLTAALKEARALGIAPRPEEVARIQEANDAIDRMNAAWTGVANVVAIKVAPLVESISNVIRTGFPIAIVMINQFTTAIKGSVANLAALLMTAQTIGKAFKGRKILGIDQIMAAFKSAQKLALQEMFPADNGKGAAKGKAKGGIAAPNILDSFEKGIAGKDIGAKKIDRVSGQLRQTVAPGGVKGAQDTLSRILKAGSATKDPVAKAVKDEHVTIKGMAKDIKKLATAGMGGGLLIGAAGAGV